MIMITSPLPIYISLIVVPLITYNTTDIITSYHRSSGPVVVKLVDD